MKKIILALFICTTAFVFADNFKPQLHISPSVRQQGFGGFYTTDVDNFYGIYANPAMLGKHKKHSLFPGLGMTLSGPLQDIPNLLNAISSQDTAALGDILSKNNGIRFGAVYQPFLSMGHTTEIGFGWGLNTSVFLNASIPNLTRSDVKAGAETVLTAGFGFPIIHTDNHLLSIGATAKGFYQMATTFDEGILALATKLQSFNINDLPLYTTVGFGMDVGIYYSICNSLEFAVVYHDPWSPAWVSKGNCGNLINFNFTTITTLEPKLSAGFCWKVHTERTRGAISSLRIMADYKNFLTLFDKLGRNPWLELNVGAEIVVIDMISLRVGLNELYPAAGIGFSFGKFKIDMSLYGKELGLEPGSCPCLNAAVFIGVTY